MLLRGLVTEPDAFVARLNQFLHFLLHIALVKLDSRFKANDELVVDVLDETQRMGAPLE